jgi:GDPmannose 4,6-dehydratase
MLHQETADDYIIATGKSYSLEQFVSSAFEQVGLDWQEHVRQSAQFFRPTDIAYSGANPHKAHMKLGWSTDFAMPDVVNRMIHDVLE